MTVDVDAPGLIPFVQDKQRLLTGLVIQAGSSPVKLAASCHAIPTFCPSC